MSEIDDTISTCYEVQLHRFMVAMWDWLNVVKYEQTNERTNEQTN